jgi:hypothetical protein
LVLGTEAEQQLQLPSWHGARVYRGEVIDRLPGELGAEQAKMLTRDEGPAYPIDVFLRPNVVKQIAVNDGK